MKYPRWAGLALLIALTWFVLDSDSHGQRFGGRGGVSAGSRGVAVGPYGGGGAASGSRTVVGPAGSASAGYNRGTYTTGRGTTVQYGGAGRTATGPAGVTAGRGAGAVQVTTPGGRTATKVGTASGVAGPGGNAVGTRSSVGAASGPRGTAASASRGGTVLGPNGVAAAGSRVGVASGAGRTVAGASRGVAISPYGIGHATTRVAAVGHRTAYVPTATLAYRGNVVRRGFVHGDYFTPRWYTAHPRAWRVPAWTAATFWGGASWATLHRVCAFPVQPLVYDYGTTVVYEGDQVYYEGEPVATAAVYADQALQIAETGQTAVVSEKEEWVSLGVFGMVQGEETDANVLFQLAVNKEGVLRGNYHDALTDTTLPINGSVDRKTQRAAWIVGDRKTTVYETGIGNLTQPQTALLVHFGKDRTQQWTLIRLDPPKEEK